MAEKVKEKTYSETRDEIAEKAIGFVKSLTKDEKMIRVSLGRAYYLISRKE